MKQQEVYVFIQKMKQIILIMILQILIILNLSSIGLILENTVAQPKSNAGSRILRNGTIALPLKYLSNFWRSFEMSLINYKLE